MTKSEVETLLAENERLEAEIATIERRLKYWRQRGPVLSIRVKQLEAENKELKRRLATWMSE